MTKIVFACKSNSCRSQMAEGWAKDWLEKRKNDLIHQGKTTGIQNQKGIEQQLQVLSKASIFSVALDSSSVFKFASSNSESCCGENFATNSERKSVKEKAIEAMARDGIDISNNIPKTINEVLPSLHGGTSPSLCSTSESSLGEEESEFYEALALEDENETKIVDKLIILCSCGDAMKEYMKSRARSVEEWNVDAPTEKMKNGEKDAYRRVSLEIKNEVNGLLNDIFPMSKEFS